MIWRPLIQTDLQELRKHNESATRHAMPLSLSIPSKNPISITRN